MSEERFDNLEKRLDSVASDVAELKTDVAELKTQVAGNSRDIADLTKQVAGNSRDIVSLKAEVEGGMADVRRHMGVLHEDVVARIRALGEDDSLRREMRAGFAELRQLLKDHAATGEAADRHFATTLDDHERRIRNLEGR